MNKKSSDSSTYGLVGPNMYIELYGSIGRGVPSKPSSSSSSLSSPLSAQQVPVQYTGWPGKTKATTKLSTNRIKLYKALLISRSDSGLN